MQLLSVLEDAASRGTPMMQGLGLYETCDGGSPCASCESCAGDLCRAVVLKFALASKWNIGVVPANEEANNNNSSTLMITALQDPLLVPNYKGLPELPYVVLFSPAYPFIRIPFALSQLCEVQPIGKMMTDTMHTPFWETQRGQGSVSLFSEWSWTNVAHALQIPVESFEIC